MTVADAMRDENGRPSERLLQAVWQHQRIKRDRLKTNAGSAIRIFHPGFISVEGGPDFQGAIIQIGDAAARSGDVEIDLHPAGWRAHGHDKNKNFQNVILHVVWDEIQTGARDNSPPRLSLKNMLDAPLAELGRSLENEPLRALPDSLRGKCCAPLCGLEVPQLTELLHGAAKIRFENKAAQFRIRAKISGWEQALWENLFRALGYKHNAWPMQNLAETKLRWTHGAHSVIALQTRLLGVSGLLPDELTRSQKSSDTFLRRAWDCWWRDRDEFADCLLPRTVWKFHGLRPANHPQRRLALAAHWLADHHFISKIEDWSATKLPDRKLLDSLFKLFQVECDEFWSRHWTFQSTRLAKPQPLLGASRVTDLAVNVVLPWLWTRAREGGNEKLQGEIERRFFTWPAGEDNSVLKLARQRLLGEGRRVGGTNSGTTTRHPSQFLKSAAAQQGLLQIVRDFCEHSNAACEHCRFPELVRGWNGRTTT